jgi:DNA polymerase alpha subunit A
MERGRRSAAKVKPHAGFAELRRLREEGKTRLSSYQVEQEEDLYEEVSEDEYKKVVRKRLNEDDFVVDDGGEGYVDNGMDDWGEEERRFMSEDDDEAEEEGGRKLSKKELKRKREEDKERREQQEGALLKYFSKAGAAPAPAAKKQSAKPTVKDKEFLEDLLGEFDNSAIRTGSPMKKVKTEQLARKARKLSPPRKGSKKFQMRSSPPPQMDDDSDYGDDIPLAAPPMEDYDTHMSDAPIPPSSPLAKAADRKLKIEDDDDDDFAVAEIKGNKNIRAAKVNLTSTRPAAAAALPTPATPTKTAATIDSSTWTQVTGALNVVTATTAGPSFGKVSPDDAAEEDGSIKMFWLDYTEANGSLILFGKVKDKRSGKYVSAFLKVDGILRNLFFLPREHRVRSGKESDEEVQMSEVYEEVSDLMEKHKVNGFKTKPTTRKYAFELPGVPREGDYLKVLYPYTREWSSIASLGRLLMIDRAGIVHGIARRNFLSRFWNQHSVV